MPIVNAPTRIYSKDGETVEWRPELCTHCEYCHNQLPEVFDPSKRPWVNINGAPMNKIIDQVNNCPSGALSMAPKCLSITESKPHA